MTNPMMDKAARALWNQKPGSKLHPWEGLGSIRDGYRDDVRAVLLAIRVPDDAMVKTGSDERHDSGSTEEVWQSMIDSILKEGT